MADTSGNIAELFGEDEECELRDLLLPELAEASTDRDVCGAAAELFVRAVAAEDEGTARRCCALMSLFWQYGDEDVRADVVAGFTMYLKHDIGDDARAQVQPFLNPIVLALVRPSLLDIPERLRWHAGLTELPEETGASIASCLARDGSVSSDVDRAVEDLIGVLTRLNLVLNGAVPSEEIGSAPDIPTTVAYPVAEVIRLLRLAGDGASAPTSSLADAAWRVETAWLAVLAGDVDDVRTHVEEEVAIRILNPR